VKVLLIVWFSKKCSIRVPPSKQPAMVRETQAFSKKLLFLSRNNFISTYLNISVSQLTVIFLPGFQIASAGRCRGGKVALYSWLSGANWEVERRRFRSSS